LFPKFKKIYTKTGLHKINNEKDNKITQIGKRYHRSTTIFCWELLKQNLLLINFIKIHTLNNYFIYLLFITSLKYNFHCFIVIIILVLNNKLQMMNCSFFVVMTSTKYIQKQ
jgi:hypothetical protein